MTMNPDDTTETATFNITLTETGTGSVVINGQDVSNHVTGLTLHASPASLTVLKVDMFGSATITGTGVVEITRHTTTEETDQ